MPMRCVGPAGTTRRRFQRRRAFSRRRTTAMPHRRGQNHGKVTLWWLRLPPAAFPARGGARPAGAGRGAGAGPDADAGGVEEGEGMPVVRDHVRVRGGQGEEVLGTTL